MNAMNTDELLIKRFPETVYAIAKRLREVESRASGFPIPEWFWLVAALAGLLGKIPFVIVCTDLTRDFFMKLRFIKADLMVSRAGRRKQQMQSQEFRDTRSACSGTIVNPHFSRFLPHKEEAKEELALDPRKFTLLLMSGA